MKSSVIKSIVEADLSLLSLKGEAIDTIFTFINSFKLILLNSIVSLSLDNRTMGKSKMNYWQLFSHSIKIHLVFIKRIFVNYFFYLLLFFVISKFDFLSTITPIFFIFLFIHFLMLIIVKNSESNIKFTESLKNIKSINILK